MYLNKHLSLLLWLTFLWLGICNSQPGPTPAKAPTDTQISMDAPRKINRTTLVDSTDTALFGETLGELLKGTRSIQAMKLSPFLSPDPGSVESMEDFPILDTQTLEQKQQQAIADLLNSERPYLEDRSMKNLCIFQPDMAFVLQTDEHPINALVSLDCRMVRFYFQATGEEERYIELSTKRAFDDFKELYADLFSTSNAQANKGMGKARSMKTKNSDSQHALTYIVKKGQGYSHVAKAASVLYDRKVTVKEILQLNQLKADHILHTGDEVIVGYTH